MGVQVPPFAPALLNTTLHYPEGIFMINGNAQLQPKIQLSRSADYRETYANSVQVRVSVWDFFLNFGVAHQETPDQVLVENNHGVYLSPQQAKALWNMLGQNLAQYEQAFGSITLEPQNLPMPTGPAN